MNTIAAGGPPSLLTYDYLIERIRAWAGDAPDINAAFLLGSRARIDHPADAWSDLDVLVFAGQPEKYVQSGDWVATIAPYWLSFAEPTPTARGMAWERRTLFHGGLDVDVALYPAELLDALRHGVPPDVADVMRRGVKILIDKEGKLEQILQNPLPEASLSQQPSEREFINATSNFWYHTLWSIRHLRRGELWWAKTAVDGHLKGLLQQMLEWHAHAVRGAQFDTWLRGRFLEEWADARAVEQLKAVYAHYERHDIARALQATMELYRWLEDETASLWGFTCPTDGERKAATLTVKLIGEMG